jgi:hypothetical protein
MTLPVVIGVNGQTMADLIAAGQPVPAPVSVTGFIDTGTDITCVNGSCCVGWG